MANNTGKKYGGRKAGTPNVITKKMRVMLETFIHDNSGNIQKMFDAVSKKNPAKALELYLKFVDMVLPKIHPIKEVEAKDDMDIEITVINSRSDEELQSLKDKLKAKGLMLSDGSII
jgi:hypothetical protein